MEQQQPGPDRKAIIAIILCAAVWAIWMQWNYTRTAAERAAMAKKAAAEGTATPGAVTDGSATPLAATTGTPATATTGTAGTVAMKPAHPEATPTLGNSVLRVKLSSIGARPISAADLKDDAATIAAAAEKESKRTLEYLVPEKIDGATSIAPLQPWFGDEEASRIPADAAFETLSQKPEEVVFQWTSPDGLQVKRTWKASRDDASFTLIEEFRNTGNAPIKGRPGVVWVANDKDKAAADSGPFKTSSAIADRFRSSYTKLGKQPEPILGALEYISVHDQYVLAAVVPTDAKWEGDSVRFLKPSAKSMGVLGLGPEMTLATGESKSFTHLVFVGPKDFPLLKSLGHRLDWAMDWGQGQGFFWAFVGLITKWLWFALRWLHGVVGNWGVAIILLTVFMRLLMYPLTARQMRMANEFAAKSAKLKPKLDALREKHKEDPMAMNRETMQLYQQHGISPFSPLAGCLPLLVQMPIWWALYSMLRTSIDLRGAPFALWINDLSQPETLFRVGTFDFRLMPLLLGAVTWVQMKLTPQPGGDPQQQKMMMWMMPAMFIVFMWSLPSGLVVYIFTSTLLGIAQQWWMKRGMPAQGTTAIPARGDAT